MVIDASEIRTKQGKTIKIKCVLNCKSYGIYAGQCRVCNAIYVGQTKNKFHVRWNEHRATWRQMIKSNKKILREEDLNDEKALFAHYLKHHPAEINKKDFSEAFGVFFVESPKYHQLDVAESFWITKLNATINIMKTFLPKIKQYEPR